ncbi:rod-binding protein [Bosea sp. AS-1]|jgi:Rod binding domain-containing protein|uniref:rod-binding protein n=1 Tax=Bosea sp. AS-1 TaxID=2015316 RepID=UPI000B776624|nr:rod-binding protein [Bosea sp. AS-1]
MTAALALPAANLALGVAGKLVDGIANALDPAKAKAKKQADDFEAMFLEQMTQHMFTNMGTEGPLGDNGTGGDVWRSQLTQQYAQQIQKAGGIGVSDQILREMLSLQAQGSQAQGSAGA